MQNAWNLYHDSLSSNEKELRKAVLKACQESLDTISPTELNSAVDLLRAIGANADASGLIKQCIKRRSQDVRFFQRETYADRGELTDPELKEAFEAGKARFKDERTPQEVLVAISASGGWGPKDSALLANSSVGDFRGIFKLLAGEELDGAVRTALGFGTITPPNPEYEKISRTAREALKEIAKESPLNERRMRKYGITLQKPEGQA
jgi:hypothetical protein